MVCDEYLIVDLLVYDVLGQERYSIHARRRTGIGRRTLCRELSCTSEETGGKGAHIDSADLTRPDEIFQNINLIRPEKLALYQTRFVPIQVEQEPGSSLVIYPQPHFSHTSHPILVEIDSEQNVHLSLMNASKAEKVFRTSTIIGSLEKIESPAP